MRDLARSQTAHVRNAVPPLFNKLVSEWDWYLRGQAGDSGVLSPFAHNLERQCMQPVHDIQVKSLSPIVAALIILFTSQTITSSTKSKPFTGVPKTTQ